MACQRSGKNESHRAKDYKCPDNKTPRIYKPRTQKCECPFKIVIWKTLDDVWIMRVANGCHNHEDLESPVVHPASAKLKPLKIIKSSMSNCDGLVDTSLHYENQLEFATRDEAKKWVLEKGKEKKCVMVTGKHSKHSRFEMVCKRSGKQESHTAKDYTYPKKTAIIYKTRATKKCECPFKIVFNKTKGENGVWKMKVANGCHNHEDPESPVVHPAGAKRKRQKILKLQMENSYDGLVGVGVQGHCSRRPPPTPSQQPSHFSSPGPSSCTNQLSRNPVNLLETLHHTQMISSPSGHQDIRMMSWNDAASQMQPVSSSMRSPTPASNQSL